MLFLIGLLLIAAAGLFFWAGHNRGVHWAEKLCRQAPILCASPYWLPLGGGAVMSLALISKAFKA
jgi:hypothetical protein